MNGHPVEKVIVSASSEGEIGLEFEWEDADHDGPHRATQAVRLRID